MIDPLIVRPPDARWMYVLGHGAGAGMRHPFMEDAAAALAAVGVALLLGVAAYLAGGPLGSGRLATVGPSGWLAAAYAAVELGVVAAVAAAAARFRRRPA